MSSPSPIRLHTWFVAGFFLVFFGLAAFLPMLVPFRDGLRQARLWEYYLVEIPQAFNVQVLGSLESGLGMVMFQHLALAVIGGVVTLGIGWAFRKFFASA